MSFTCAGVCRPAAAVAARHIVVVLLLSCVLGLWLHSTPVLAQPDSRGTPSTAALDMRRRDRDVVRRSRGAVVEFSQAAAMVDRRPQAAVLQVHLYVDAGVHPSITDSARRVAEDLLSAAGVATMWWIGDASRCAEKPGDGPDVITILRSDALRRGAGRSCGFAARAEHNVGGSLIVSVACVAEFAFALSRSRDVLHPWLVMPRHDDLVGVVIAHEIAHLLGVGHASAGVMRSGLHREDVLALRAGTLAFEPDEVMRLRMGLAAASATRTSPETR